MTSDCRLDIYSKVLIVDDDTVNSIIKIGNTSILKMKSECMDLLEYVEECTDTDIEGKLLQVIEVPMTKYHLTKYLQEFVESEYPLCEVLRLKYEKDGRQVYSLRSLQEDIRVDLLAQKYEGNGHYKASGYSVAID